MLNSTLHERVAKALNWTVAEAQSVPLHGLRELVRPVSPKLAAELTETIQRGTHSTRPASLEIQGVTRPR